jgi:hypothetical protein
MNKSYQEISRSKSFGPRNKTSILKDPSQIKLKHNRSVRFLDLESSSEESVECKSVCQQQIKDPPPPPPPILFKSNQLKFVKRESCANQVIPTFIKKNEESKTGRNAKKLPSKPVKKSFHSSASPKIDQKVMNFDFRDKNFYAKLNKFISSKGSVSPERTDGKSEEMNGSKKSYTVGLACKMFSHSKV